MTERQSGTGVRRYRSRVEAAQLAAEYRASGLTRREFAGQHRVSLNTLNRYISRHSRELTDKPHLLRVELTEPACKTSGVAVLLACGRRVELAKGFDASTLAEAVSVLERV